MAEAQLFGAGGHAAVVAELLQLSGLQIESVWDDNPASPDLLGTPVQRFGDKPSSSAPWIVAVGSNRSRKDIVARLDGLGTPDFLTAKHPTAWVSPNSHIGEGTVVIAHATVNARTVIGRHCIINTSVVIGHDCVIGDYAHVSALAAVTGGVHIGEGTHVGAGASIIPGVRIGDWCTVGAGAVVIRDVPDGATVVGNPARVLTRA